MMDNYVYLVETENKSIYLFIYLDSGLVGG